MPYFLPICMFLATTPNQFRTNFALSRFLDHIQPESQLSDDIITSTEACSGLQITI